MCLCAAHAHRPEPRAFQSVSRVRVSLAALGTMKSGVLTGAVLALGGRGCLSPRDLGHAAPGALPADSQAALLAEALRGLW